MKKIILLIFVGVAVLVVGFVAILSVEAFNGPTQAGGSGAGAIGVNGSNNVSFGTSTPNAGAKILVVGSSTNGTDYSVQVVQPNGTPILIVHDDGSVSIATTTDNGANTLTVAGQVYSSGNFNGIIGASNISSGQFGTNTGGGNYYFSGSLGVATTSVSYKLDVGSGGGTTARFGTASAYCRRTGGRKGCFRTNRSASTSPSRISNPFYAAES